MKCLLNYVTRLAAYLVRGFMQERRESAKVRVLLSWNTCRAYGN
jgi:hypothetical protein